MGLRASLALSASALLVAGAHLWGEHLIARLGADAIRLSAPPLVGWEDPAIGWPALVAVAVGAMAVWVSVRLVPHVRWSVVVALACTLAVAWSMALAVARSPFADADPNHFTTAGITQPLVLPGDEYLLDVPRVGDDPRAFLRGFTSNIDRYSTHVRSHPPFFLLGLWGLDRIGLGGTGPAAALCLLGWAAAVAGVLVAVRAWCGEQVARAAAPFVALAPAALWAATTADAFYAGVGAWSVALATLAVARPSGATRWLAGGAGLLAGAALLLSYGLLLLMVPLAMVLARRRDLAPVVGAGALVPLLLARIGGFDWIDGLGATRHEYAESVASTRPFSYFVFANLAALAIVIGPATVAGIANLRDRSVRVLLGGFGAALVLADLSGLSKGEVERIWLPFAVWLPVAAVGLPGARRTRPLWLSGQVGFGLAVQLLVRTRW